MSENRRVSEGDHLTALVGGAHPESVSHGWNPGESVRGHQPTASVAEPATGPASPSGSSSANASASPGPTSPPNE
jgi:hypothetical protein